jgi:hypothetical protein
MVAMWPMEVDGVTITGRPKRAASSSSTVRYSGAET